jgi:hypothetical protein
MVRFKKDHSHPRSRLVPFVLFPTTSHIPSPLHEHGFPVLLNDDSIPLDRRRPRTPISNNFGPRPGHLRELRVSHQLVRMRLPARFRRPNMFGARMRGQHIPSRTTPARFRRDRDFVWKRLWLCVRVSLGVDRDGVQRMPGLDRVPERIYCGRREY